jgi:cysteine/O-acetylserine efflux protein
MNDLVVPCLTYVVLMTFTPGPNNVSASALGVQVGYRRSLPFLFGITTGFMVIMLFGGLFTDFLTRNWSQISPWLKWVGVAYMAWLAVSLFVEAPKKKGEAGVARQGYAGGFFLQFVNPKGILYGVTVYTSFASILTGSLPRTIGSAAVLTAIGFSSVSIWALVGSALSRFFENRPFRLAFNGVMALLLAWSAISIILH